MALQSSSIDELNTFLGKTFYIPNYQREYAWEQNELDDFWADLEYTKENEGTTHFFGQIVVHNDDGKKKYIIDGQQRTITSMIFMRVLQIEFEELYKRSQIKQADYKKSDIESKHIGREDELHLTLGDMDNDYFRDSILLGIPSDKKEKKKSHENLRCAFYYFKRKVDAVLDECSDDQDRISELTEYYNAFINRFCILYMEATKLEEAFIIFETLNARGRDLETADLLKNYIFSQSKEIENSQKKWNSMIAKLEKVDPTKYIRHYLNSNSPFSREKELYRTIKSTASNPRLSKELLNNLEKYASCYHDLINPDENTEFSDAKLIASLKALKTLKASSFYPVVLAMKQAESDFSEADIRKVVEKVEVYIFRNFTICGNVANRAEMFFASLAKEIYDGQLDSVESITDKIKAGFESDAKFEADFIEWKGTKSSKDTIRYILRKIHNYIDKNNELNIDNSEVHIEHIMPEDPSLWNIKDDIHTDYLWRLGNLALLSGPLNIKASNKPFAEKVPEYKNSKIEPNNILIEYSEWNKESIESRQRRLFEYAKKIWGV